MDHGVHDRVSTELAAVIADGLRSHPEWIAHARDNIRRWSVLNSDAPRLLRCYAEWSELLEQPIAEVIAVLRDPTDRGQRMRTNSPFAGVIGPRDVWAIKQRVRNEFAARSRPGHMNDRAQLEHIL